MNGSVVTIKLNEPPLIPFNRFMANKLVLTQNKGDPCTIQTLGIKGGEGLFSYVSSSEANWAPIDAQEVSFDHQPISQNAHNNA